MKSISSIAVAAFMIFIPGTSYSGFISLTMFSRANCMTFNESVSWDAREKWRMEVESDQMHEDGRTRRFVDYDPGELRHRAYAGCHFCGNSGWSVSGEHSILDIYYPEHPELIDDLSEICLGVSFVESHMMWPCKTSESFDCNSTEW